MLLCLDHSGFASRFLNFRPVTAHEAEVRTGSNSAVCRIKNSTAWPVEADSVDRRSEPEDAGSVDGSFWDKATIAKRTAGSLAMWQGGVLRHWPPANGFRLLSGLYP
jgi:hypothetical protein